MTRTRQSTQIYTLESRILNMRMRTPNLDLKLVNGIRVQQSQQIKLTFSAGYSPRLSKDIAMLQESQLVLNN